MGGGARFWFVVLQRFFVQLLADARTIRLCCFLCNAYKNTADLSTASVRSCYTFGEDNDARWCVILLMLYTAFT